MKYVIFAAATATLALSSLAHAEPSSAEIAVQQAREACETIDGGQFDAGEYLTETDLNRDGKTDLLIDESRFSCSTSASLFSPNGGARLHAVVGESTHTWQAHAWRIIEWGDDRVLLLALHGTHCGVIGYQHCYEAVVYNEDTPTSVSAPSATVASPR